MRRPPNFLLIAFASLILATSAVSAAEPESWRGQVIDPEVGKVCYAVVTADVDGDGRLDVVAVANDAVVWYRNPTWEKRDILRGGTEPDNVCLQPHDVDGDGRIDFALGSAWRPTDTQKGGNLGILTRTGAPEGSWRLVPIGSEPTLHRVRWGRVLDKGTQLVVAPLQGRGTRGPDWGAGNGSRLLAYSIPPRPFDDAWPSAVISDQLHTIHNISIVEHPLLPPNAAGQLNSQLPDAILVASWEGVFRFQWEANRGWNSVQLGTGDQASRPNRGTSEVRFGNPYHQYAGFMYSKSTFLAAIEPWHGHQFVVYGLTKGEGNLRGRIVIDDTLAWGHAVACADLDGDSDDEIVIGQRDPNPKAEPGNREPGVLIYRHRPKTDPPAFDKTRIDPGGVAVEDLTVADLDGDGRPEIVAGGRATHNVKIYWNPNAKPR